MANDSGNGNKIIKKAKDAAKHYPVGTIPGQSAAGHHPFASKAQQRLFFANPKLRRWAIGKAHATGEYSGSHPGMKSAPYAALPERKVGATTKDRIQHAALKGRRL